MAAKRFGSPGPTGSGSSREVNTDPDGESRNCGLVDMSCKKPKNFLSFSNT